MSDDAREKIIWALAGALLVAAFLGFFWLGKWQGAKKCGLTDGNLDTPNPAESQVPAIVERKVPSKTAGNETAVSGNTSQIAEQTKEAEWKTFTNNFQDYKFSYPADGNVVQAQTSGHPADVDPTDGACVSLKLANGYVTILGKTHTDDQATMCLRTGVGTEWNPIDDVQVEAFGKKYTANGMGTSAASAGYKKEFYYFKTNGGERVEFGIEVNEKYAPETTYGEAKAEVLAVLKTLRAI